MDQSFNYEEALLGLTTIVAWADGENQSSEVDARVKMMFHEGISADTLQDYSEKHERIGDHNDVYRLCVASLKTKSASEKAKACAWMYQVAMVAANGKDGDLDYIEDTWEANNSNLDNVELEWINKARADLGVSLAQQKYEFEKLPKIERV